MTQIPDFGTTVSCTFDIDPAGLLITGRRVLSEALIRRILTPRGRLLSDPNYGFDLAGAINNDMSAADANEVGANMDQEFTKDERVVSSTTIASFNQTTGVLTTSTTIDDGQGPFPLVLSVSNYLLSILSPSFGPVPVIIAVGSGPSTGASGGGSSGGGGTVSACCLLDPVIVTAAMSPYSAVPMQSLVADTSGGSVIINMPLLSLSQKLKVKHGKGTLAAPPTLTVNAPVSTTIEQPVPNNGTFASSFVFTGAGAVGESFTWTNVGLTNQYTLE